MEMDNTKFLLNRSPLSGKYTEWRAWQAFSLKYCDFRECLRLKLMSKGDLFTGTFTAALIFLMRLPVNTPFGIKLSWFWFSCSSLMHQYHLQLIICWALAETVTFSPGEWSWLVTAVQHYKNGSISDWMTIVPGKFFFLSRKFMCSYNPCAATLTW